MIVAITAGHSETDPGAVNPAMKLTEAGLAVQLRDSVAHILREIIAGLGSVASFWSGTWN